MNRARPLGVGDLVATSLLTLKARKLSIGLIIGSHADGRMLVFWTLRTGAVSVELHEPAALVNVGTNEG